MLNPENAGLIWFGKGRLDDASYLKIWRTAPTTYLTDHELDEYWNVDHYETVLGKDSSGELFQRAAQLVLANQFYPPEVMVTSSDFRLDNRAVQAGDRVLQRIRLFEIVGKPLLEILTMNKITDVVREARRSGITYTTTTAHNEIGEWEAAVEWRENGEVILVIDVDSRARPGIAPLAHWFIRRMQLRAHCLGIANFVTLLNGGPRRVRRARFSAELLPIGLLLAALLFGIAAALVFLRKK